MLGVPDPMVTKLVGELREFDRGAHGFTSGGASHDRRQIEQGERTEHEEILT